MSEHIQGLGWFLRRTTDPLKLGQFYVEALGLPRLRSWQTETLAGDMLWAGGVCVFEVNLVNDTPQLSSADSQCIPVFRSYNLRESMVRVENQGACHTDSEDDERSETHFFQDPDGYPFAIEFVKDDSLFAIDQNATLAWQKGPDSLPGPIQIEGNVQRLSRVIHMTPNPCGDASFLVDRLGLEDIGMLNKHHVLALGNTAILELRSSDIECDRPEKRDSVRDIWILREFAHQTLVDRIESKGEIPIECLEFEGGTLNYYVTPENRMFGFQERRVYNPDVKATQTVEDMATRSLWVEQNSTS